jgi:hypothetical protein
MLRQLRSRLTYANVMSTIACFGVLATGTAYAANTVFSTDIVDGEVKSVDIGNGEVNSADVKDQSLTTFDVSTFLGADIVDGSLTGADLADDSVTAARLGPDVQPSIRFNQSRTAGTLPSTPLLAGTRLRFLCSAFKLQVSFQNLTGTQGMLTASYVRRGNTPTLVQLPDDNGGFGVPWLDTFNGGTGNDGGAGTLVWRNGTRVVSADFSYLVDADHCEFYGTMHTGTAVGLSE